MDWIVDWIVGLDCGLDCWTGLMNWIDELDWWTGLLKRTLKFLYYGRECWMSKWLSDKKKCAWCLTVLAFTYTNGETEDFPWWEAYLWYISIHKLSWPHYSEAIAGTSQTTNIRTTVYSPSQEDWNLILLVRCCQWLMQHVFIASMVITAVLLPLLYTEGHCTCLFTSIIESNMTGMVFVYLYLHFYVCISSRLFALHCLHTFWRAIDPHILYIWVILYTL